MSDEVAAALATLLTEVRQMRREMNELPARVAQANTLAKRSVSAADREQLAALLPAIHEAVASMFFSARDLFKHSTDPKLVDAIAASGLTCKQLGRLFARCHGIDVNGARLMRLGPHRDGVLWKVLR